MYSPDINIQQLQILSCLNDSMNSISQLWAMLEVIFLSINQIFQYCYAGVILCNAGEVYLFMHGIVSQF